MKTVIEMAREAGAHEKHEVFYFLVDELHRFAELARADEREACAKLCDAVQKKNEDNGAWMWEARNCAAAIRARGETK